MTYTDLIPKIIYVAETCTTAYRYVRNWSHHNRLSQNNISFPFALYRERIELLHVSRVVVGSRNTRPYFID